MANNENPGNLDYPVDEASNLITLSDVLNVIRDDEAEREVLEMFHPELSPQNNTQQHSPQMNGPQADTQGPYVEIEEQPAPKALRFRYECEGRSAGAIPGVNSTSENKTYPTIKVKNYTGRAVVVVSCVTKDFPYKPHPHNLVGREGCRRGVCTLEINSEDMRMVFSNLGVQCVKKKDIDEALRIREEIRVDPFRTGYNHRTQPSSIDLNAVRLCFQVFLEGPQRGKFTTPVKPVVSEPIYDKKSMSDLVITKLSHCNAICNGGQEMILLCEKIAKEDIQIRFYEETVGGWEGFGDFPHSQVHKQVAIPFRTPRYKTTDITDPVKVKVQLRRPSDGATSEPLDFEMLPLNEDQNEMKRKRHRSRDDTALNELKSPAHDGHHFKVINDTVKLEPTEHSISPYAFAGYREQAQATPSPQPLHSPQMFTQVSPSPSPYHPPQNTFNNQLSNVSRIVPMPSSLSQPPSQQPSHIFTPNIQSGQSFLPSGSSQSWNNLGTDTNTGRTYANMQNMQTSSYFPNYSLPPPTQNQNMTQNSNILPESTSLSGLINMEINNLSGEIQSMSISEMELLLRTGERSSNAAAANK